MLEFLLDSPRQVKVQRIIECESEMVCDDTEEFNLLFGKRARLRYAGYPGKSKNRTPATLTFLAKIYVYKADTL